MFASTIVLASLCSSAFATLFITQPVATTTCVGGQTCNIAWEDNGVAPSLAQWGNASVNLYTGNALQQTLIQPITASVDVATTNAIQFTVNPAAGQNGDFYFIRVSSLTLMDATNPQFPELAFSAKFTLSSMTGTFNATVSAQIAGTSTAPIGGSTSATPASTAKATAGLTTSTTKATSTGTAKPTGSASSAGRTIVPGAAAFAGAVAALFL